MFRKDSSYLNGEKNIHWSGVCLRYWLPRYNSNDSKFKYITEQRGFDSSLVIIPKTGFLVKKLIVVIFGFVCLSS